MSHYRSECDITQIRSEQTEIEPCCGIRADLRVKLGRHPAKSQSQ